MTTGRVTLSPGELSAKTTGSFLGVPDLDPSKCTGCGQCAAVCPSRALMITDAPEADKRFLSLSYGECIFCGLCGPACPHGALADAGKYPLATRKKEDLFREMSFSLAACREDKAFVKGEGLPSRPAANDEQAFRRGDFAGLLSMDAIGKKVNEKVRRLYGRSLHIREVDAGSCNGCEVEVVNLSNPVYDAERFGVHFVASPRHADMLLVTGPVTRQMELALVKTYEATPAPKLVVACGSCAIGGGIFEGQYAVVGGVDRCVPVDVYVPGCPPRPEAILYGIFLALDKNLT